MMSFGWRPVSSCYRGSDTVGTCPAVNWFWGLLAIAAIGGMVMRKK